MQQIGAAAQLGGVRHSLFESTKRLGERGLESSFDRHHFTSRLHLGAEHPVCGGKLVERPARDLHNAIVERRFEGGARLAGDGVGNFVQHLSGGDLCRHPRDRIAGRLRSECRRPAHARIDFDHVVGIRTRIKGKLDIAAALDAKRPNDAKRSRAEHLDLAVGEGLTGRDHDAVPGMHPHGVDVLHIANRNTGVVRVAHDFVLDFLPPAQRPFDQHLANRAGSQAFPNHRLQLERATRHPAAGAAQRVSRTNHERKADARGKLLGGVHGGDGAAGGDRLPKIQQHTLEGLSILGFADRGQRGAQNANLELLEDAGVGELDRQVQSGLPAEGGQQAIGPLPFDDGGDRVNRQGLDIHAVGNAFIGHDRRRVGVHQHGANTFLAQRFTCLRAGIVELGCLSDDDRSRADHEHRARTRRPRAQPQGQRRTAGDQVEELVENRLIVLWTGSTLGVELHTAHR